MVSMGKGLTLLGSAPCYWRLILRRHAITMDYIMRLFGFFGWLSTTILNKPFLSSVIIHSLAVL